MINIYTIKIDKNLNKEVFNNLLNGVTEEKRLRVNKFRHYTDSQRSLFGELIARYAIKKTFNLNYKANFDINDHGKPHLAEYPNIHFNISHSGDWVVCAVSGNMVGIDVEEIKPVDLNIAKRFFTNEEYQPLLKTESSKQQEYFFKIWTLKESYIKAVGKGLSIPLNSFYLTLTGDKIEFVSEVDFNKYSFAQFMIDESHIIALCTKNISVDYHTFQLDLNIL